MMQELTIQLLPQVRILELRSWKTIKKENTIPIGWFKTIKTVI